jgi:hypothetical protein
MKLRLLNILMLMSPNNDSDQHEKRAKILEIIRFSKCFEMLGAVNFSMFFKSSADCSCYVFKYTGKMLNQTIIRYLESFISVKF